MEEISISTLNCLQTGQVPMIYLYYCFLEEPLSQAVFSRLLQQLPLALSHPIGKFRQSKDRHLGLFGKLLLRRALQEQDGDIRRLTRIGFSEYKRPYFLEGTGDFNIAHSGDVAVCVFHSGAKVGVDVEREHPIELAEFRSVWRQDEWVEINGAKNPQASFFSYWTRKEAVVKAIGTGLYTPLQDIYLDKARARSQHGLWYVHSFLLAGSYPAAVACNLSGQPITITQIPQSDLIQVSNFQSASEIGR